MKTRFILLLVFLFLLYFLLFPTRVRPHKWHPPKKPAKTGIYEKNNRLDEVEIVSTMPHFGPEDVAVDSNGIIYAGSRDGWILKIDKEEGAYEPWTNTGGRPLGMHFSPDGSLLVADAYKGLLQIDQEGDIQVLTNSSNDIPFRFTDDLEVAPDGKIYFSDASHKYYESDFVLDIIECAPNGRLLMYDPVSEETVTLVDTSYFTNGVAVDPSGQFVLFNETSRYRVLKYWIEGPKTGKVEVIIDNLPGYPDGISSGTDGVYWLTLVSPRNDLLDKLHPRPGLKRMMARIPRFLLPKEQAYAFVLGIDGNGEVKYNLQGSGDDFAFITNAQEFEGRLYLGSLKEQAIGILERP